MKLPLDRLAILEREVIDPALEGACGEVMRSAGYPHLLWQRVRELEQRLRACESTMQALERAECRRPTLRARIGAALERLRSTARARGAESALSREARSREE